MFNFYYLFLFHAIAEIEQSEKKVQFLLVHPVVRHTHL